MAAITQTIINLDKRSNIISDQKFNIEIKPDSNFSQKKYSGFDKTLIALPNNILYKILLTNNSNENACFNLEIDGRKIGSYIVRSDSANLIERPANTKKTDGMFTFFDEYKAPVNSGIIPGNKDNGVIKATINYGFKIYNSQFSIYMEDKKTCLGSYHLSIDDLKLCIKSLSDENGMITDINIFQNYFDNYSKYDNKYDLNIFKNLNIIDFDKNNGIKITVENNKNHILMSGRSNEQLQKLKQDIASNDDRFMVFVRTLTGKTLRILVLNNIKVIDLKWLVYEQEAIPIDQQRMILGGSQLDDNKTIQESKIQKECTLHLVLRLRGGGGATCLRGISTQNFKSVICGKEKGTIKSNKFIFQLIPDGNEYEFGINTPCKPISPINALFKNIDFINKNRKIVIDKKKLEDKFSMQKLSDLFKDFLSDDLNSKEDPEPLICPITHEIMKEPWITPYGHSYEKNAIFEWLNKNDKDPLTRRPLRFQQLIRNFALESICEMYLKMKEQNKKNLTI
jgi:hypothetical protein